MKISERGRKMFAWVIRAVCGVLGFGLLMWTPATASGLFFYLTLLAVMLVIAIFLPAKKDREYRPGKRED